MEPDEGRPATPTSGVGSRHDRQGCKTAPTREVRSEDPADGSGFGAQPAGASRSRHGGLCNVYLPLRSVRDRIRRSSRPLRVIKCLDHSHDSDVRSKFERELSSSVDSRARRERPARGYGAGGVPTQQTGGIVGMGSSTLQLGQGPDRRIILPTFPNRKGAWMLKALLVVACLTLLMAPAAVLASELTAGDAAPDFSLRGSDGKTHSLADYAGKVVVAGLVSQGVHRWLNARVQVAPGEQRHDPEVRRGVLRREHRRRGHQQASSRSRWTPTTRS